MVIKVNLSLPLLNVFLSFNIIREKCCSFKTLITYNVWHRYMVTMIPYTILVTVDMIIASTFVCEIDAAKFQEDRMKKPLLQHSNLKPGDIYIWDLYLNLTLFALMIWTLFALMIRSRSVRVRCDFCEVSKTKLVLLFVRELYQNQY